MSREDLFERLDLSGRVDDHGQAGFMIFSVKDLRGVAEHPEYGYLFIVFSFLLNVTAWHLSWMSSSDCPLFSSFSDFLHLQPCSLLQMWLARENIGEPFQLQQKNTSFVKGGKTKNRTFQQQTFYSVVSFKTQHK